MYIYIFLFIDLSNHFLIIINIALNLRILSTFLFFSLNQQTRNKRFKNNYPKVNIFIIYSIVTTGKTQHYIKIDTESEPYIQINLLNDNTKLKEDIN